MRTTQQLSITLPNEMAREVKSKVQTGQYATESEVIREALRALTLRDRAVDEWLQREVVPAYEKLRADPSSRLSAAQVRAHLASVEARLEQQHDTADDRPANTPLF